MRNIVTAIALLLLLPDVLRSQTAEEVKKLIARLDDLDSIDIARNVKFREGLLPPLHALDADEAGMKLLDDPYQVFGRNQPGAAGWYRVTFTVPAKIGVYPLTTYNLGVESNCLGTWEAYTYRDGKPGGTTMIPGVQGTWSTLGVLGQTRQPASAWVSNAPLPCSPGTKITVAILATASPLGSGSPDGYALRRLRLRFALRHTSARQPFFGRESGSLTTPGTGLHGVVERLSLLQQTKGKEAELKDFQERIKGPLGRLSLVFKASETGKLDDLTAAMQVATREINDVLRAQPQKK
jgi:hypothetical protein